MKTIIFILAFLCSLTSHSVAQKQWEETDTRPDGSGVTDIVVTDMGTLIVTTSSWSMSPGFMGGIRRSTNEGHTWENPLNGFVGRKLYLGTKDVVFAVFWDYPNTDESIYRSTNEGVSWTLLHSVPVGDNIFSIASKNDNIMIFIGTRNGIKRSINSGTNWAYVNSGIPANSWVRDLAISTDGDIIAAATTNGLYTSSNKGNTWQKTSGIPQDTIIEVGFLPEESDRGGETVYYAGKDGRIYKYSFPSAAEFVASLAPGELGDITALSYPGWPPNIMLFRYSTDPNEPNGGVLISRDFGSNWAYYNSGLPADPPATCVSVKSYIPGISSLTAYVGTIYYAPDGAAIYRRNITLESIGIQQISSEIPDGFSLQQNYPNPFNPSTKIKFDLPANGFAKLAVYDVLGREAALLVNENLNAGSYEYTFDGAGLPSGVYFYKLKAGDFVETKRMIFLK